MPPTTLNTKGSASPEDVPHGTWDFFPWEPFPEYAGSKSVLYRSADRRVVAGATRESGTGTLTYPCDEFFYVIEGWARLVVHGREMFTLDRVSCIPNFAIVNYLAKSRQHVVLLRPSPANLQPGARAADPFPQFNRLFPELRWMVWEQALSHERVLHVELREPLAVNDDESKDENEAETNDGYSIVLKERRAISKLFRVNAESRHVVLCFYRVQLPCHYQWNGQLEENGTLYFNPELDTLQFRNTKYLAMFGHDDG
ncbi:hypothetical protein ACJ41O_009172 [Fusarium nematophilum]